MRSITTLLALLFITLAAVEPAVASLAAPLYGEAVGVGVYEYWFAPPEGAVLRVRVEVYEGSGRVVSLTRGDSLFHASLLMACYEAALLAERNPWSLDFVVKIERDGRDPGWVRGPSLGLPVFIATYSALTGMSPPAGLASTGVVQPDGLIGWVGHIYLKAETIARSGYSSFLIPVLQNVTIESVVDYETRGPYLVELRKLELRDPGLEKLNITILQARGVLEAVELAFGTRIGEPYAGLEKRVLTIPESRVRLAYSIARIYEREIERDIEISLEILEKHGEALPRRYRELVLESVSRATRYLEASRELRLRGMVVAPLDALALSYYYAKNARYVATLVATGDPLPAIREALSRYIVSSSLLRLTPPATPDHLLTLSYSYSLVSEASEHVATIISLSRIDALRTDYAMQVSANIAYLSLKAQLLVTLYLVDTRGLDIPYERLYEASRRVYEYYSIVADYTAVYTVGADGEVRSQLFTHLSRSKRLAEAGDYSSALQAALEASGRGLTILAIPAPHSPLIETRLSELEKVLSLELSRVKRVPLITLYYLELASLQKKPEYRLYYLELALAYLRAYRALHMASGVGEDFYTTFWAAAVGALSPTAPLEGGVEWNAVEVHFGTIALLGVGVVWRRVARDEWR